MSAHPAYTADKGETGDKQILSFMCSVSFKTTDPRQQVRQTYIAGYQLNCPDLYLIGTW